MAHRVQSGPLIGQVEENQYVSPTGAFRVTIPVSAALGGSISDTENVVTFQDSFTTHESIACFKMDASLQREHEARGRKDFLIWFFSNFVQADFEHRFPGARVESAHFLNKTESGSLLIYNLLPGGSMFSDRIMVVANEAPRLAKRGNLAFVHDEYIFIISIELTEKVLERSAYNKTVAEEDEILRKRLLGLLGKVTFAAPPAIPAANLTNGPAQIPATAVK
ncbi:MAG: hypothetical protein IPP19_03390 [Verrucomicrobia bacterium]|nr:hypothetical protein [Verrucomicrobiota bacterium]